MEKSDNSRTVESHGTIDSAEELAKRTAEEISKVSPHGAPIRISAIEAKAKSNKGRHLSLHVGTMTTCKEGIVCTAKKAGGTFLMRSFPLNREEVAKSWIESEAVAYIAERILLKDQEKGWQKTALEMLSGLALCAVCFGLGVYFFGA